MLQRNGQLQPGANPVMCGRFSVAAPLFSLLFLPCQGINSNA